MSHSSPSKAWGDEPHSTTTDTALAAPDLAVSHIKAAITAKRDWKGKIMSLRIVDAWRAEATEQGASVEAFDKAVSELKSNDYYVLSGIVFKDGLMPPDLVERITRHLDRVAAQSTDFQPHSDDTVRNLIHPSLFCYVRGESWPPDLPPPQRKVVPDIQFVKGEANLGDPFAHCVVGIDEESRYQWLPSEVDIDGNGRARLASYVNNAPSDPGLLHILEEALSRLLPSFEQVITPPGYRHPVNLRNRRLQVIVKAANYELRPGQTYEGGWHVEGMLHEHIVAAGITYYGATPNMCGEGLAFRRLRNRNVVRSGEIPAETIGGQDYYDSHERRYAVAVSDDNWESVSPPPTSAQRLKQHRLGSERGEEHEEEEEEDREDPEEDDDEFGFNEKAVPTGFVKPKYLLSGDDVRAASLWNVGYKRESMPNFVDLGVVETPPGRTVVFKNSMQHQVRMLWNSSSTETAVRKILVFWLVDPEKRVVSTADVPPQQWESHRALVANLLHRQWRPPAVASQLSVGAVKFILQFAKHGFTHEEACEHRLHLMQERKYSVMKIDQKFQALIRRIYSFCEH